MNLKNRSWFFFGITFLFGCEKEVTFKIPELEPKMVVNCLFSPDSLLNVHLSYTKKNSQVYFQSIDNAQIKIYENNSYMGELKNHLNGVYLNSTIKPKNGSRYQLKIFVDGQDTIYTDDILPLNRVSVFNFKNSDAYLVDENAEKLNEALFTISDPIDENNYYEAKIYYIFDQENEKAIIRPFMTSKDPVIIQEGDLDYYPSTLLFTDELFNGKKREISIYHGGVYCDGCDLSFKIALELKSISSTYYRYKKSLVRHLNNQDSDIWDGVASQVQMYSNVKNGYGIFAGYNSIIDTIVN